MALIPCSRSELFLHLLNVWNPYVINPFLVAVACFQSLSPWHEAGSTRAKAPELASTGFHLLLLPLQLGHCLASSTTEELRMLRIGVSARFMGPGEHHTSPLWTSSLCQHLVGLSESLCRGWAKEMGKRDCFGEQLNLLQWEWGGEKKKKKRPEKGMKSRKVWWWSGWGESSHGVRAPLLLALGDLGSLLYFSPLRHIYIKLLWAECFLVLVSALFKHKCFKVHR